MVGERAVGTPPDAHIQSGGGDSAPCEAQRVHPLAGERVLYLDRDRIELRADPADGDVPAAVDHEARVPPQAVSNGVRREALPSPAGVDAQPRRASHGTALVIDLDLPPA